jgi:hypothetical protein
MTRTAAKTDNNQKAIVATLRAMGCSVQVLSGVGKGVPDLLVGFHNQNMLMEVKGLKGKLTPDQIVWHGDWHGQKPEIVRSCDGAIAVANGMAK